MRSTLSVLLVAALVGCSGNDDTDTDTDTTTETGTTAPAGCVQEGDACVLEGTILEDLTLTADVPWLLRSAVIVGDDGSDVTLTIEPGTTVYGESATNGLLVVTRGAKIVAEGTAQAPIRFTSDQPVGSRSRGDWGGLAINGRGPINACAGTANPCEAEGEGGTGTYGGDDPNDSSGSLRYVVIEFGGTEISPDNEINGLGLQGVGSGTDIDYVQIHRNLDDGIEFWGGTVSVRHLLVTDAGDDGIDWDLGWQGKIQYAAVQQADDAGNNGWETDNNEADHVATPISSPTVSNVTVYGSESIAEDNFGLLFRRGSSPTVHNVAVANFSAGCLAIRDQATFDAFAGGAASLHYTALACGSAFEESTDETEVGTEDDVFAAGSGNQVVADLMLVGPSDGDLTPAAGSPLLGAGQAPADPWFEDADFIGAFGTTDWTEGWTTRDTN